MAKVKLQDAAYKSQGNLRKSNARVQEGVTRLGRDLGRHRMDCQSQHHIPRRHTMVSMRLCAVLNKVQGQDGVPFALHEAHCLIWCACNSWTVCLS